MKKKRKVAKRIKVTLRCIYCTRFAAVQKVVPGSIGEKVPLCLPHWHSA